jgi:hypothetical protein
MIDKGVVSAEELRRQLAEALPGATSIMVEAYNNLHPAQRVTMEQFIKLQEAGKILSNEILSEFANVLEKRLSPALAGKQSSLDASLERVTTQFFLLKTAVTNTEFVKFFTNTFGEHLKRINAIINSESVPAFEKLSRIMLEYMALGSLNSSVIEKQIAKEQMAAAASAKINKDALDGAAELMELNKSAREEKMKALNEEASSYAPVIAVDDKRIKAKNAEIALINKSIDAQIKKTNSSEAAGALEIEREKQIAEVSARFFDAELSQTARQYRNRVLVINGILEETEKAIEQEKKSQEAKNKELEDLEKLRLQNVIARLEQVRLQQGKNTKEELDAHVDVIKAETELAVFLAKGRDQKNLARLKGELAVEDAVLKFQRKAQKQSLDDQIAAERERLANVEKGGKEELIIKSRIILLEAKLRAAQADLSQQEIDAILAEADSAVIELTKKFDDAANKAAEAFEKNKKKISDGIQAPFLDAIGKEEKAARDHYENLLALNKNNLDKGLITREEYNKNVIDLEEALQKELKNITEDAADDMGSEDERRLRELVRKIRRAVNAIGGLYQDIVALDIQRNDVALQNLENRLDQGLISEKEYERQKRTLLQQQFEAEKRMQIARAIMSGANSIMEIIGSPLLPLAPILIPIVVGITGTQIGIIQSQVPAFKDGVINLKGPGTGTSDSVAAMLSRGESVMTAKETEKYGDVLRSIRNGTYDSINKDKTLVVVLPFIFPTPLAASLIVGNALRPQTPEGFKDGVIGINGPGTSTSDSILARLSKGESVMTAAETNKYRDVLSAIREDSLPSLIAEKYMIPSYKNHMDESRKSKHKQTSMEMAFQAAEMVNAIKGNKVIKLHHSSIKELTANSGTRAADKILARRSFR